MSKLLSSQAELAERDEVRAEDIINAVPDSKEKHEFLSILSDQPDALDRNCRPGHFTGSSLVVDPTNCSVLLLYHSKLKRWLQPGGHADGDRDLARVALREAIEETGINDLQIIEPAIDLDNHFVDPPDEEAHHHYDVRFLVIAPTNSKAVGNHESEALTWVLPNEFDSFVGVSDLERLVAKGLDLTNHLIKEGLI